MDRRRLLAGLDEDQLGAVTDPHRPLAILAPAGSGKTRVLTRRVAWLAAEGHIDAGRTLCVAFTRDAAGELRQRLGHLGLRTVPAAGTFHSVALALLRIGWASRNQQPLNVVPNRAARLARLDQGLGFAGASRLDAEIGWAKARSITPDNYVAAARRARRRPGLDLDDVRRRWRAYDAANRKGGLADFDDLLARCAELYETDPAFAAAQRWRFQHLFVDEFQDVNPLQFRLLGAWLGDSADVTVVGDAGQAIYGWNGAAASYLTEFETHFPGAAIRSLRHNYRSSPQLVSVAAAVRDGEAPRTARGDGPVPQIVEFGDAEAEEAGIVAWARACRDRGTPYRQQAILVRTRALARRLATALAEAGVAVSAEGIDAGTPVMAFLRGLPPATPLGSALVDVALHLSLAGSATALRRAGERVAETPAGPIHGLVGARDGDTVGTDVEAIDAEADPLDDPDDPDDATPPDGASFDDPGAAHGEPHPRRGAAPVPDRRDRSAHGEAMRAVLALADDHLAVDADATVGRFLAAFDADRAGAAPTGVTVSTFHAAKGREWRAVHVAGVEDGYVPLAGARGEALAEERRLLYVALTRAVEQLTCSWTRVRRFGDVDTIRAASPWLDAVGTAASQAAAALAPVPPPTDLRSPLARPETAETRLRQWRDRHARAVSVPAAAVLPDDVIAAVAAASPRDEAGLAAVPGVGPLRAARLGPYVLAALHGG